MQLKKTDVWVEVPINERLPDKTDWYNCYNQHGDKFLGHDYFKDGKFQTKNVTHWLEKLPNQYCFTEEELSKLLNETWETAERKKLYTSIPYPDKETFINNLFNK